MSQIISPKIGFENSPDGLLIRHTQEIPEDWMASLRAEKLASVSRPTGDLHRAASIPVVVYERWMREGYDPANEPIAKTLAKLQAEGLDNFITTSKRL